jgi:formylglycine-generating enzyme required for sulfatase activity
MRTHCPLFAGLALVLAACAAAEPPPAPLPPVVTPPAPVASVAPTAVATTAPTAVASAAPTAVAAVEPPKAASPCPTGMALVPGGAYTMTRPKREVTVGALCMDLSETTADEYAACVKTGKCSTTQLKCAPQATYETPGKGNYPITCVDMEQAVNYCGAQGKRLASDEEWEWVARGGAAGHTYAWGDDKPNGKACWSGESTLVGPCAVGSLPAGDSPQGIHDLAGNVFEWTTSRNDSAGDFRIGRGGSWKDSAADGLKASRTGPGFKAKYRCGFLGIRCVMPPAKP